MSIVQFYADPFDSGRVQWIVDDQQRGFLEQRIESLWKRMDDIQ